MARSGWCMTGRHVDHPENPCPSPWQKFVHVPAKRNKPATIEFLDEWLACDCKCHGGKVEKKSRKRKK